MAKCPYCGGDVMDGARFCTACGHRLASPDPSVDNLAPAPPAPAPVAPASDAAPIARSAPASRPGSAFLGGMLGALGAGIGCLILLGLLFAGCMALLAGQH